MIPISFEYKQASSIDEAITMLDDEAQVLGGGHSLIPALKLRLNAPSTLVDISKIESIQGIKNNDKSVTIGAGTTHAEIANNADLAEHCPMMPQAAKSIGDIQVRNKGTIGGSMAHADPAADWPAVLLASDANINIQGKGGKRTVDIDQFFKGFFETALEDGEIITGISVPKTAFNTKSVYMKFKQPASRFALAGVAVAAEMSGKTIDTIRIGVTGVGEYAYRAMKTENALKGKELNEANIAAAIAELTDGVTVMSDHYASEKYRTHLAQVVAKRALNQLA